MVDYELLDSWAITRDYLRTARDILAQADPDGASFAQNCLREYDEFLHHNELELALDMLEEAVTQKAPPREFWEYLVLAAKNMGLEDRARQLLREMDYPPT